MGRYKVGRKWWTIIVVTAPLTQYWGYFDYDLNLAIIDGTSSDKEFMDTLIHEFSHGLDPSREEKVIKKQGNVLADLLTAFGYKN